VEQQAVPIAGQKENTSSYRKVEVYCWIVVFVLLACIMDINNNSKIQLQFQKTFFLFL
jgi:hypothetical protein